MSRLQFAPGKRGILKLLHVSFQGPPIDDPATLATLPDDLRRLLSVVNGFIQFGGGLHVRGACKAPDWHALSTVLSGDLALAQLYPSVLPDDVPFAQDVFGDQFLLRQGVVHRLSGETGEVESLQCSLFAFLESAQTNPIDYLNLGQMARYFREGGDLQPGQLLSVWPPFCMEEAANGVSFRAISSLERLAFLAWFARQTRNLADGTTIEFKFVP